MGRKFDLMGALAGAGMGYIAGDMMRKKDGKKDTPAPATTAAPAATPAPLGDGEGMLAPMAVEAPRVVIPPVTAVDRSPARLGKQAPPTPVGEGAAWGGEARMPLPPPVSAPGASWGGEARVPRGVPAPAGPSVPNANYRETAPSPLSRLRARMQAETNDAQYPGFADGGKVGSCKTSFPKKGK